MREALPAVAMEAVKFLFPRARKGEADNSKAGAAAANAASKNYEYANQKPAPKFLAQKWDKLNQPKQKQL